MDVTRCLTKKRSTVTTLLVLKNPLNSDLITFDFVLELSVLSTQLNEHFLLLVVLLLQRVQVGHHVDKISVRVRFRERPSAWLVGQWNPSGRVAIGTLTRLAAHGSPIDLINHLDLIFDIEWTH